MKLISWNVIELNSPPICLLSTLTNLSFDSTKEPQTSLPMKMKISFCSSRFSRSALETTENLLWENIFSYFVIFFLIMKLKSCEEREVKTWRRRVEVKEMKFFIVFIHWLTLLFTHSEFMSWARLKWSSFCFVDSTISCSLSFSTWSWSLQLRLHSTCDSPQNGIPSGVQLPFSHARRDGPSSSKPRSHEYDATDPWLSVSSVNVTVLWAGDPGNWHFFCCWAAKIKRLNVNFFHLTILDSKFRSISHAIWDQIKIH